jgi:hypothetical protein
VVAETALKAVRRTRKGGVDVAFFNLKLADQIGPVLLMQDRAVGSECLLGVDNCRQRLEIIRNQLGGVFRQIAAFRKNDGDRLTNVPHFVVS